MEGAQSTCLKWILDTAAKISQASSHIPFLLGTGSNHIKTDCYHIILERLCMQLLVLGLEQP